MSKRSHTEYALGGAQAGLTKENKRQQLGESSASSNIQKNIPSKAQEPSGPSDVSFTQSPRDVKALPAGLQVPLFSSVTPWISSEISTTFPPLPPILDPLLETAAFTHSGMASKDNLSYDRLEWIGDAYVELISSCLIFQTFGGLPTGKCSQLRELLVQNATLGGFTTHYGLLERAHLPPEFKIDSDLPHKAKRQQVAKVQGDLFEAYVAAVILSDPVQGLSRATEWLKALWSMTIKDQILEIDKKPEQRLALELGQQPPPAKSLPPKVELTNIIVVKGVELHYEEIKSSRKKDKHHDKLDVFTVGVYLKGWGEQKKLLGTGSDRNMKEAGQKAATVALSNKKLMKLYREKKRAFIAAREHSGTS